ncbi:DNA repair protein RecO [Nafulsella turpanensis]|uniref:DNA repair protein RecO n=1 Tax=Nafulsella turpanensis TaxID=1265690 RepID=UPI00034809B0|nr:DNA repair protein RecO [Nafulsella turpanensis]
MLHKTKGIVLNYLKYGESSIIVKVFTEEFGMQSYIVNSVRSSKAKSRIALFQPLTLLDMVVYYREQTSLHRIKEMKCIVPFTSIPFEFRKSGIALFMTEVLLKTVKGEEQSLPLFEFLQESVLLLDRLQENYSNFHLQFLLQLSSFLGFAPGTAEELYEQVHPGGNISGFAADEKEALEAILQQGFNTSIRLGAEQRKHILRNILQFYRLHVDNFGELKSLSVLQEVMS